MATQRPQQRRHERHAGAFSELKMVLLVLYRRHGLHRLAGGGAPGARLPDGREMGAGGPQVRSATTGSVDAARRSCCRQLRPAAAAAHPLPAAADRPCLACPSAAWSGCKRCAAGWRSSTAMLWSGCHCLLGTCRMRWACEGQGFSLTFRWSRERSARRLLKHPSAALRCAVGQPLTARSACTCPAGQPGHHRLADGGVAERRRPLCAVSCRQFQLLSHCAAAHHSSCPHCCRVICASQPALAAIPCHHSTVANDPIAGTESRWQQPRCAAAATMWTSQVRQLVYCGISFIADA